MLLASDCHDIPGTISYADSSPDLPTLRAEVGQPVALVVEVRALPGVDPALSPRGAEDFHRENAVFVEGAVGVSPGGHK